MVAACVHTFVARHEKWRAPLDNCEHVATQTQLGREISANVKTFTSANMHFASSVSSG